MSMHCRLTPCNDTVQQNLGDEVMEDSVLKAQNQLQILDWQGDFIVGLVKGNVNKAKLRTTATPLIVTSGQCRKVSCQSVVALWATERMSLAFPERACSGNKLL